MNLNAEGGPRRGSFRAAVRKVFMVAGAIMCLCLVLSGCKATSTLTVTLGEKASGDITLRLVLDKEASSAIRRDSYNATTLSKIFDVDALEKAGFKVSVKDKSDESAQIDIAASFSNEKQLRAALLVLAPADVVNATLNAKTSLFKEKQSASIVIDVSKLRSLYLEDDDVKSAVEEVGIEFSEFESLVNDAMKSTTFTVVLKQSGREDKATVTGDTKKTQSVALSHDAPRTRYLSNMSAAIACGIIALGLFWRLCRTPRLLSKQSTKK